MNDEINKKEENQILLFKHLKVAVPLEFEVFVF